MRSTAPAGLVVGFAAVLLVAVLMRPLSHAPDPPHKVYQLQHVTGAADLRGANWDADCKGVLYCAGGELRHLVFEGGRDTRLAHDLNARPVCPWPIDADHTLVTVENPSQCRPGSIRAVVVDARRGSRREVVSPPLVSSAEFAWAAGVPLMVVLPDRVTGDEVRLWRFGSATVTEQTIRLPGWFRGRSLCCSQWGNMVAVLGTDRRSPLAEGAVMPIRAPTETRGGPHECISAADEQTTFAAEPLAYSAVLYPDRPGAAAQWCAASQPVEPVPGAGVGIEVGALGAGRSEHIPGLFMRQFCRTARWGLAFCPTWPCLAWVEQPVRSEDGAPWGPRASRLMLWEPGKGTRVVLEAAIGREPQWSRDGSQLLVTVQPDQMWVLDLAAAAGA